MPFRNNAERNGYARKYYLANARKINDRRRLRGATWYWFCNLKQLKPLRLPVVSAICQSLPANHYKSHKIKIGNALRRLPEMERLCRRKIRQRLKNMRKRKAGKVKVADILWLQEQQCGNCFYCLRKLQTYHVDHFIPISKGGLTERSNLRLACEPCNLAKSDKLPEQFLGTLVA